MPRSVYTDGQRAEALALVAETGIAAAHRATHIPKQTLSRWASSAGIDLGRPVDKTREATKAAAAARAHNAEQWRTEMVALLAEIAERAARKELEVLAEDGVALEKIVGARTRAIHDVQLLSGAPTQRVEHRDLFDSEIEKLTAQMADA